MCNVLTSFLFNSDLKFLKIIAFSGEKRKLFAMHYLYVDSGYLHRFNAEGTKLARVYVRNAIFKNFKSLSDKECCFIKKRKAGSMDFQ